MGIHWRGTQVFTGTVDVSGATKIGMGDYALAGGRTYYVDDSGSDGRRGSNPRDPLKTTTAAIAKCTASVGDAVVVMQRSPSTAVAGETWPINLNKDGMLLTGLYSRAGRISDSGFGSTPTNTNCINVGANFVAVENLYLQVTTGTTGDVIQGTATRYGFGLRNCWIGLQNTSRYGFYTGAGFGFPYLLIEDNTFSAPNVASMTSAILLFNATFGMIRRNIFYSCSSYAVDMGSAQGVTVLDNDFRLYTDTKGFALYVPATTNHCYFARNHAMYGLADMSANPYLDLATDGKNAWSMNALGDLETYPATS